MVRLSQTCSHSPWTAQFPRLCKTTWNHDLWLEPQLLNDLKWSKCECSCCFHVFLAKRLHFGYTSAPTMLPNDGFTVIQPRRWREASRIFTTRVSRDLLRLFERLRPGIKSQLGKFIWAKLFATFFLDLFLAPWHHRIGKDWSGRDPCWVSIPRSRSGWSSSRRVSTRKWYLTWAMSRCGCCTLLEEWVVRNLWKNIVTPLAVIACNCFLIHLYKSLYHIYRYT